MSTIIMSKCWDLEMPPTQKSVLISLADNANDQGVCWPSIPTISRRTCFSERAVQNAIKWLERYHLLKADRSNGRHTSYTLTPGEYLMETPAADAPAQQMHGRRKFAGAADAPTPAGNAGVPPQQVRQPPQQVPSNRKEPSTEPSGNRQRASAKSGKTAKTPALFERLWLAYPRKQGKADAEKAFGKLAADEALLEQMLAAIAVQAASAEWREEGGKFIPHCSTWLNGQRWLDEGVTVAEGTAEDASEWWQSSTGIEAKGATCWRARKSGEDFQRYKVGVFKAAGEGPWRQALLADLLRTKSSIYVDVHVYFYGHPPAEGQA
ncbi:helix-turn-helix protein [Cupriavidus metallidurans]|uniref:helix-turn-helix domain-containing protein n=1 Tax=Cupriavidus TaxID=106589 RepID=UPI0006901D38|nr:helix-turn-helix domain-containing protein [Cupriavidus metallidurans]MDE4918175.1 helix-turn-helix domain-containing protein [Cupriavidus metallidurans]